jgi:hypothetical protein
MGNHSDVVGWGVFRCADDLGCAGWFQPNLASNRAIASVVSLLAVMAASAVLSGTIGYVLARRGVLATDWLTFTTSPALRYRFMADWWAPTASYGTAFVGGVVLCVMTFRRRRLRQELVASMVNECNGDFATATPSRLGPLDGLE